jgi:hypothetical protein
MSIIDALIRSGHGPDDIEPFQNAMPMQDRLLTNSELYDFLSPMKVLI